MQRILIVEDDSDIRTLLVRLLTYSGFETASARDGREALTLVAQAQPDLIIMDLALPVLDGWSTAQAIRHDPRTASTPILALTANAWPMSPLGLREELFNAVLTKPFDIERLMNAVKLVMGDDQPLSRAVGE